MTEAAEMKSILEAIRDDQASIKKDVITIKSDIQSYQATVDDVNKLKVDVSVLVAKVENMGGMCDYDTIHHVHNTVQDHEHQH